MINIFSHSLLEHYIAVLKRANTASHFRWALERISNIVAVLSTSNLPFADEVDKSTELGQDFSNRSKDLIVFAVSPSGLVLSNEFSKILPKAKLGYVSYDKDPNGSLIETLCVLPKNLKDNFAFVVDFDLSDGQAICNSIARLEIEEVNDIAVVTIFASAEGIEKIRSEYPNVSLNTCYLIDEDEDNHLVINFYEMFNRY